MNHKRLLTEEGMVARMREHLSRMCNSLLYVVMERAHPSEDYMNNKNDQLSKVP